MSGNFLSEYIINKLMQKIKCKNWKQAQPHLLSTAPASYFCWSGVGVGDRSRLCLGAGMLLFGM
jgi:hypothetical protein